MGVEHLEKKAELGQRLRQLMEELELNYEELGQRVGMRPQTLNRYVLGQRDPKAQVVAELALKLEVDPLWLQGFDVPRQRREEPPQNNRVPIFSGLIGSHPLERQPPEGTAPAEVSRPEGYCYLRMTESGMEDAGILVGDLVLIRRQDTARSGQMVLCGLAGRPAVLRWYFRQEEWIVLQPARAGMPPELLPSEAFLNGEAEVLGVAVGLTRRF